MRRTNYYVAGDHLEARWYRCSRSQPAVDPAKAGRPLPSEAQLLLMPQSVRRRAMRVLQRVLADLDKSIAKVDTAEVASRHELWEMGMRHDQLNSTRWAALAEMKDAKAALEAAAQAKAEAYQRRREAREAMLARQPGARREYKVALDAHRDSVESWRTAEKVFRKAEVRFEEASKRAVTFGMARAAVQATTEHVADLRARLAWLRNTIWEHGV